ncbi:Rieske 2Fe-2S domain-containing protein [Mycobacteroides saopaulense]|uniref:Rieske 2Fe-2S domain-containing protein n=1 Tax=Mycobacteroides saopaulense TaxID=1578165 RepID=UPI000B4D1C78|nr:aromatic ring-hydroxylating dioxygenase subunit alpha [Mycobacteroides saopaulense]
MTGLSNDSTSAAVREIDVGTPPTRFARGWHCLGMVSDFLDGQPHSISAFGTKLVVFADSRGAVHVLDAYCRHLGGDLSQGTVKGDAVACPFHDWRWAGNGRCTHVSYAKRAPRLARTRVWISDVRSGLLFVWHDPEGSSPSPDLDIPDIPEVRDPGWTEWSWRTEFIASNCREIVDNIVDMAHFYYIHFGFPTHFKNVFEGQIASQYLRTIGRPDVNLGGSHYAGEQILDSEASYFGPSFMINRLHNSYGGYQVEAILVNCHYPVTSDSFVLQWGIMVRRPVGLDANATEMLLHAFTDGVSRGFLQDVEIWKNKTRIDNPLLVEEDGPVYQLRRWYEQFYVDAADVTPEMTDRFEYEVDTNAANEYWRNEVAENLQQRTTASAAGTE